jgi:hypothetical protein
MIMKYLKNIILEKSSVPNEIKDFIYSNGKNIINCLENKNDYI